MTRDLKDKVVLVTGASTGIGAAAARRFAACGAHVALHFNASEASANEVLRDVNDCGVKACLVRGDVTQPTEIRRIVSEVVGSLGRIDILVNNAGGMVARRKIEEYDERYLAEVMQLNVVQVALFLREVVPQMKARKSGCVINVASIAARNGGGNGGIVYAGAKGFIATATRGWAKELVSDGIRVNAVSPGVIATPFHERHSTAASMERMRSSIPMGRIGSADECAGAFIYLASDEMSGYVTGQIIEVNGGQYMP